MKALTSWQTTIAGILAGLATVQTAGWSTPEGTPNWTAIGSGCLLAILGAVAKDRNATGGTVPVTPEAKERVDAAVQESK